MSYWMDSFTGETWDDFQKAGGKISGFSEASASVAKQVAPGDVFLCYMTGVKHWIGALKVIGPSDDKTRIWKVADFPIRFAVEPILILPPEHGVPREELAGKVVFYKSAKDKGKYEAFVRRGLAPFAESKDGDFIMSLLKHAKVKPVVHPVDPKKLARKPFFAVKLKKGEKTFSTVVTIPESDADEQTATESPTTVVERSTLHTEIEHRLLALGSSMDLDLWLAKNDRRKEWNEQILDSFPNMLAELPVVFNHPAMKIVELIDVLWLKGKNIVAAFEVECTTSVYSGLLRMSDLLALAPNMNVDLYVVAPEERRQKFQSEILRPTFSILEKPLPNVCRFISFNKLVQKLDGLDKLGLKLSGYKPADFLDQLAESFKSSV